jgi:predicted phage tail protein
VREVILAGELGKRFGRSWRLDVRSPAEAIRALEANRPGFCRHLVDSADDGVGYRVLAGRRGLSVEELRGPFGEGEPLRIVPVIGGASDDQGMGKIIVGILLVAASFFVPPAGLAAGPFVLSAGSVAMFGVALIAGGVSMMMAPTVAGDAGKQAPSYGFNGPVNTVGQGGPVPVGYGRLIVGSQVIGGGITVAEETVS